MISASLLALLSLCIFLVLLFLLFRFFIFKKVTITYGEFNGSRAVYRVVKGDLQTLQKEQSIFTRRAQSLWGKEMHSWPTFRIIFPNFFNKYAIFGIIVPESFNCDNECLEELGFKFGFLDSIPFVAKIEIPTRFCYSLKLNQYRAFKAIKLLFKNKNCSKIADNNKEQNKNNNHINTLKQNQDIDSDVSSIGDTKIVDKISNNQNAHLTDNTNSKNEQKNEYTEDISKRNNLIDKNIDNEENEMKNLDNENNIQNINNIGNQPHLSSNDNNSSVQINDDENNNNHEIKSSNNANENNDKQKTELLSSNKKGQIRSPEDSTARIKTLTDDPPFAEIRYKKKKKQIFITPLMNYNELVGLWKPTD